MIDQGKFNEDEDIDDDIDFIGGDLRSELENLDSKIGDLQSLNLFGVEMDAAGIMNDLDKRKKNATKEEINNVL